jgi:hypothetical protein
MERLVIVTQVALSSALILAQQFAHHRLDSRVVVACVAALALLGVAPVLRALWIEKVAFPRELKSSPWILVPGPGPYGVPEQLAERPRPASKRRRTFR